MESSLFSDLRPLVHSNASKFWPMKILHTSMGNFLANWICKDLGHFLWYSVAVIKKHHIKNTGFLLTGWPDLPNKTKCFSLISDISFQ